MCLHILQKSSQEDMFVASGGSALAGTKIAACTVQLRAQDAEPLRSRWARQVGSERRRPFKQAERRSSLLRPSLSRFPFGATSKWQEQVRDLRSGGVLRLHGLRRESKALSDLFGWYIPQASSEKSTREALAD